MNAIIMLLSDEPKQAEVWASRHTDEILLVHPVFVQVDQDLNQVGFLVDNGKDSAIYPLPAYPNLKDHYDLLGDFETRLQGLDQYNLDNYDSGIPVGLY